MKMGRWTISMASVAVLVIQLSLVSMIAAKYLWQRGHCPRVWVMAQAYDPELPMRGRYVATQLTVDACQSTLPSAKTAQFPRDVNGAIKPGPYVTWRMPVNFRANLRVANNKLMAVRVEAEENDAGEEVWAMPGAPCDQMRLRTPTNFYIAEHAESPLPLKPGQELWIEVTVPPKGRRDRCRWR